MYWSQGAYEPCRVRQNSTWLHALSRSVRAVVANRARPVPLAKSHWPWKILPFEGTSMLQNTGSRSIQIIMIISRVVRHHHCYYARYHIGHGYEIQHVRHHRVYFLIPAEREERRAPHGVKYTGKKCTAPGSKRRLKQ